MDECSRPVTVELDGEEVDISKVIDELSRHLWGLWCCLLYQPLPVQTKRYIENGIKNHIDTAFDNLNKTLATIRQPKSMGDTVECLRVVDANVNDLRDALGEMVNIFVDHDIRSETISLHYRGAHRILPVLELACHLQVASAVC